MALLNYVLILLPKRCCQLTFQLEVFDNASFPSSSLLEHYWQHQKQQQTCANFAGEQWYQFLYEH
jgi:hypothetical protein